MVIGAREVLVTDGIEEKYCSVCPIDSFATQAQIGAGICFCLLLKGSMGELKWQSFRNNSIVAG